MSATKSLHESDSDFYNPPGGLLIWIVIIMEVLTFGMALIGLAWFSVADREVFRDASNALNVGFGLANTIVLLISGFYVAASVVSVKSGNSKKTVFYLDVGLVFGLIFILVKSVEYYDKIQIGIGLDENIFYMFYWLLTGFHLLHIIAGAAMLLVLRSKIRKGWINVIDIEAGAAFWHMCDLIWLLLFPSLYLIF